jgi:hypothetical protein
MTGYTDNVVHHTIAEAMTLYHIPHYIATSKKIELYACSSVDRIFKCISLFALLEFLFQEFKRQYAVRLFDIAGGEPD